MHGMILRRRCVRSLTKATLRPYSNKSAAIHATSASAVSPTIVVDGQSYDRDHCTNVPDKIVQLTSRKLHRTLDHPLYITKRLVESHFYKLDQSGGDKIPFNVVDDFPSVVSVMQNFDQLLVPTDHVSRSTSDTYYLNKQNLLRTHTSAHQVDLLRKYSDNTGVLLTADVYRRDEVDATHYPVFHQMEGLRVLPLKQKDLWNTELMSYLSSDCIREWSHEDPNLTAPPHSSLTWKPENLQLSHRQCQDTIETVATHLQHSLERMIRGIFKEAVSHDVQVRWVETYFPFTSPSWEMEIFFRGNWMEILGCGLIQDTILQKSGMDDHIGWAFGIGLERLAMALFDIPDIRLFWSQDPRFLSQFTDKKVVTFRPFSNQPANYQDISFWLTPGDNNFHHNDFNELVRDVAGDLAEHVQLMDEFVHPKLGRTSRCYRVVYRSMERTLSTAEVDLIQRELGQRLVRERNVSIR